MDCKTDFWAAAQTTERAWWQKYTADCAYTGDEEWKQREYARFMGIHTEYAAKGRWLAPPYDLGGRSVLDIGGGPCSLLLKCVNRGKSVVQDPISTWPAWVLGRYQAAGIDYVAAPGEDARFPAGAFDEVWIYNCLQHVRSPQTIVANALRIGRTVRIFEWLDANPDTAHPHRLTLDAMREWCGGHGQPVTVPWSRGVPKAFVAVIRAPAAPAVVVPAPSAPAQFRFHLLGLAHLPTHPRFTACAFTQKIVKLARMLADLGHEVIFYGGEGSEVRGAAQTVVVLSAATRDRVYGPDNGAAWWFKHAEDDDATREFNRRAIESINARKRPGDFLLCPMGRYNKPIADAVGLPLTVESGVGYRGVFAKYRVFESYAQMHRIYGERREEDGNCWDAVIPNYWDPAEFPPGRGDGGYHLFLGRIVLRKGIEVAVRATRELGIPLKVAGQGALVNPDERLAITDAHVEHVGVVGVEERARLMGGAAVVWTPTYYIEPFGGVAVEAQLCGTPVISTDWGAFPETVVHGVTGFRCRTFDQFMHAAAAAPGLDRSVIRRWAADNYSLERVGQMYQEYFTQLHAMAEGTSPWLTRHPLAGQLSWLTRHHPGPRAVLPSSVLPSSGSPIPPILPILPIPPVPL